jgi:hypothetical protein
MRKILFLFTLFFVSQTVFSQVLDFFKEEIVFEIDSAFFTVNGDYYFRNNTGKVISPLISYPLRSNDSRPLFETVMVYDQAEPSTPLPLKIIDTAALFTLHLSPHSEKMIKVIYRQRHNGSVARYILLTTKFWNKPFENALYSLVVKKNIAVKQFPFPPDRSVDFGDATIYYWSRKNFMPEKDFEVKFNVKDERIKQ